MANTIKLKRNSTAGQVPSSLADGELAINTADEKLFIKNASGTIVEVQGAGGGTTLPSGGSNGQVLATDGSANYSWVDNSGSGTSLPSQSGKNGLFLMTNGTSASWEVPTFFLDGGNSGSQETGSADLIFDLS